MFVIEVIPLLRGTAIETLSYYSSQSYAIGTIISVPIRSKLKRAIVTDIHTVSDSKSSLKAAAFSLKKLPPQEDLSAVPDNLRETALALSLHYPAHAGAILYQLLPPEVRQGKYAYPKVSSLKHSEETTPRLLTARRSERYIAYRSHVRSCLARRGSVILVVPSSVDTELAYTELATGIEDRVVCFHAHQTSKERKAAYAAFEDTTLAKLIIVTSSHAYLDRVDLISVIVEQEGSDYYLDRERPYIDHRTALIMHAKTTGRSIILGDILPRTELEHLRRNDLYLTAEEETKRIVFSAPLTIIEQKEKPKPNTVFSLFSKTLREDIEHTLSGRGRAFLFSARRGIAPLVTCIDCGHIFRCPNSGTPYSLIRTHDVHGNEERWFISTTSGTKVRAADTCPDCGSWRLRERGIGVQTVYDECREAFPGRRVLIIDKETASTRARAEAIIQDFYSERSTILVGTQVALPFLARRGVDFSAIVSYDATRATPTWRADEHTLRFILELRDITEKEVLVQSRAPKDSLLEIAHSGLIESFYTEELALREQLSYPPFAKFILLSWQGSPEMVKKTEHEILSRTTMLPAACYNNPLSNNRKVLRHALFRVPAHDQVLTELIAAIRHFPPYVKVEMNPSRIV
jgi:primosomal protein N' (replication factor Y)